MEMLVFFAGVPLLAGTIQFFLTRSRASRRCKRAPAIVVSLVLLLCFLGMIGWLPLPKTYWLDQGSFLAFPDYLHVGVICLPALLGLGLGALFAIADWSEHH